MSSALPWDALPGGRLGRMLRGLAMLIGIFGTVWVIMADFLARNADYIDQHGHASRLGAAKTLALVACSALFIPVIVAIHELGHGAAGCLVGLPPRAFVLGEGALRGTRRIGRLSLELRTGFNNAYTTFWRPPREWRAVPVILGGPAANFGLCGLLVRFGSGLPAALRVPLVMMSALSGVLSLLPGAGPSGAGTDGTQFARLLRPKRTARWHLEAQASAVAYAEEAHSAALSGDAARALELVDFVLSQELPPEYQQEGLRTKFLYLTRAMRYADSIDVLERLAKDRSLTEEEHLWHADVVLSAHLTSQRAASAEQLEQAHDVVFARLSGMHGAGMELQALAAVEHSAALACLTSGRPREALEHARAAALHVMTPPPGEAVPDGSTFHLWTARATEGIAAWQSGEQADARRLLADLRSVRQGGLWVDTLAALVERS
ncbi:MAG: hypothetical protein ABIM89_02210 [Mycobacteriales bacterium]